MFVISSRSIKLIAPVLLVLLSGLACSTEGLVVTLTPTLGKGIIRPTMTTLPTVVYPTISPSSTPTSLPDMVCGSEPVKIVCEATVCVVRSDPHSGKDNIAYTVPNHTVLEGAFVCVCPTCASLEREWFFLGQSESGDEQFWAIDMNQVWELETGE